MLKSKCDLCVWVIIVICLSTSQSNAQTTSNVGRNFWVVNPKPNTTVLFITSTSNTTGLVNIGVQQLQTFTVSANQITTINIPSTAYLGGKTIHTSGNTKGIQILVDAQNPPIVVYEHVYDTADSAATVVLPVEALGSTYYSIGWRYTDFIYSIVAITPSTTVLIHPRINGVLGATFTITLNSEGEVYHFAGSRGDDYTGTYVEVDPVTSAGKTFAMFSGNRGANIPAPNTPSSDILFQQLYASASWGEKYVYVPFTGTLSNTAIPHPGEYIGVLAQADNTHVTIGSISSVTLSTGQFCTLGPISTAQIITADQPISVAEFATGSSVNAFKWGDPDMVILNSIESNINDITVFSSTKMNILDRFINIAIPSSAATSFKVNGNLPANGTFVPINDQNGNASGYSYLQLNVGIAPYTTANNTSSLHLTADAGFNAICYGFGPYESYSYSAGTNIVNTAVSLIELDPVTNATITSACINQPFKFQLSLPYSASQITWTLDGGTVTQTIQMNPTTGSTSAPYLYDLANMSFASSGNRNIGIKANYINVTSGPTSLSQTFTFQVAPISTTPTINLVQPICAGTSITLSVTPVTGAVTYTWSGTGVLSNSNTSTIIIPSSVTAAMNGSYTYTLSVWINNCTPPVGAIRVDVTSVPVIQNMRPNLPVCTGNTLALSTDYVQGATYSWEGPLNYHSSDQNPIVSTSATVAMGGSYTLTVFANSCSSTSKSIDVAVNILPFVDAGSDLIIGESSSQKINATSRGVSLTYQWNPTTYLDDATVLNPTVVNPKQDITYTLTAKGIAGCMATALISISVPIHVPNIFTPNSDGIEDKWVIEGIANYPNCVVKIFDKWGALVYSSTGYKIAWDGTYKGYFNNQELAVATYYYQIVLENGQKPLSGYVAIIR